MVRYTVSIVLFLFVIFGVTPLHGQSIEPSACDSIDAWISASFPLPLIELLCTITDAQDPFEISLNDSEGIAPEEQDHEATEHVSGVWYESCTKETKQLQRLQSTHSNKQ